MQPDLRLLQLAQAFILTFLFWTVVRRMTLNIRVIVWSVVVFFLLESVFIAWVAQFLFVQWNANPACPLCQVHLPPYSNYWYQESFFRYGAYFGVNAAVGLVFGLLFWIFSRMTKGRVIDRDDVFLLTLAGMMVGWPNILVFLVALFVLGVLVFLAKRIFRSRIENPRVVITPLIPLAALPIIFLGDFLASRIFNLYDIGLVAITLGRP